MGQLTNQYVSQSFQGLLNLENATTGVTSTLQYVTDGIGNRIPMQASTSSIVISGSFYGDGSNLTGITATNAVSSSYSSYAVSSSFASNATSASFAQNAVTASIANDLVVVAKNNNPSTLLKGTIVRITGVDGNNPLINTASWIDDNNSANTLGMVTADVAPNGFTNVVVQGKVENINTNGMTPGALLYLSSSGQYTVTPPPAPYHEVRLGQVLRSNTNNGSAYISVDNGYELSELHDVDITNPVNGDLLVYRSGSYGQWVNETGAELGFATTGSLSGYTTLTQFNNYTGSNDTKVNDLISKTGSYATLTGQTALSASIATTDLNQDNRITALENVTGSINRNGLITTGSIGGTQSITGSLNVEGTISATSASFTYVNTVYETASVIYSSGSNQFGDASNDTQTLWGRVSIPTGPVSVTGSVIATNFTGSLQGTASYATTTLSSSFAQNAVSASQSGNANTLGGLGPGGYARVSFPNTFSQDQTINSGSSLFVNEINTDANEKLLILSDGNAGAGARIIFGDTPQNPGDPLGDTSVSITGSLGVSNGITGTLTGTATNANNFSNRGIAQFALTGSNSFNGNQTVTGNVTASLGFFGNLQGTASFATNALSASYAPSVSIDTGSLVQTVGLLSPTDDTVQVIKGDGTISTFTINNIQSSSFATNALSASYAPSNPLPSGLVSGSSQISYTGITDVPSGIVSGSSQIVDFGFATTSSLNDYVLTSQTSSMSVGSSVSSSYSSYALTASFALNGGGGSADTGSLMKTGSVAGNILTFTKGDGSTFDLTVATGSGGGTIDTGSFATTGSNVFIGSETIETGSLIFRTPLNSTPYAVTESATGTGNNIYFGSIAPTINTGSFTITGSNNIVSAQFPATVGYRNIINGHGNIQLGSGGMLLSTASLMIPQISANIGGGAVQMYFTTSSLSGGVPVFGNNFINGFVTLNIPSGSLTSQNNNIQQPVTINAAVSTHNTRNIYNFNYNNAPVTLNAFSSSIAAQNNTFNGGITVNNHYTSSNTTGNQLNINRNAFFGQNTTLNISGSNDGTATFTSFNDNLIAGNINTIQRNVVGSISGSLTSTGLIGNGLGANATNRAGGNDVGTVFVGRWNDTGSLANSNQIVFAVGTGTSTSARRTALWIDSGSFTNISGSLSVKGVTNALVVTGSQTIQHSIAGQSALTVIAQSPTQPALTITGSFNLSGSAVITGSVIGAVNNLTITSNTASLNLDNGNFFTLSLPTGVDTFVSATNVKPGQTVNLVVSNGGTGTISFSNNIKQPSGSFYTATTGSGAIDVVSLISIDNNNLYMNNLKNLI